MKIEIKDFGPIQNIVIDLNKDLHLIYGENAIGKSYVAYCLYSVIKNIKNKRLRSSLAKFGYQGENGFSEYIQQRIKKVNDEKEYNCTPDFLKLIDAELSIIILKDLQNSLLNTFSSLKNLKNRYTKKNYNIIIHVSDEEKLYINSDKDGVPRLKYKGLFNEMKLVLKNTVTTKFTLTVDGRKAFGSPTEKDFVDSFTNYSFFTLNRILQRLDFNVRDVYYLPASRSGLYQALSSFTPILAELTQNRFFMKNRSIELPSLSEPLSDYFIDLSTVDKKFVNIEFDEIIKIIETDILKGKVEYDDKSKKIIYSPKGIGLELNLSEASSMVSELSPLVLFFKHIINNKYSSTKSQNYYFYDRFYMHESPNRRRNKGVDFLFIEEPEAHLHPLIQIKLIEVFIKLLGLNLKIVITSHSNYMFNKINNLILKKDVDFNRISAYHLIRSKNGSTVVGDMEVSSEGINDDNFQDVSELLYFERLNSLN